MKPLTLVVAIVVSLCSLAQGQTLKNEKYTLPNGMVVILHEDHTLPTVSVNIWYRVGARNEPPRRSGFAHLFEHLMFMGTKRVPDNQFDVVMETGGGANNASTSLDRTNYFSWGPSELLSTLLWLDADRLERMGLDMTLEKLNKQRDVVRNELRQTVENAPYQKAYEASYQILYPPSHPYHNGVIGTHEDLEAAQVQNVQDFFATFYVPGNASLVVAGDFDSAKVKPLIADWFGTLARGNAPKVESVQAVKLDTVIRTTTLDKVQLPQLAISYHSPAQYKDGDAECDLLAMMLAQGQSSRLYKRLVIKDQSAVDVSASQDSGMLGSVFRVVVQAKPEADLAAVEKAVDEEIESLLKDGPSSEELSARQAQVELSKVSPLQSVQLRADRLNEYEFYFGNPDSLQRDLDRYRKATGESLIRWGRSVMTPGARLIQVVLPEEPETRATSRDAKPQLAGASGFVPASPELFTLSNGIKVQMWSRPSEKGGLPLAAARIVFSRPGQAMDTRESAGLADLLADMLSEGTGELDGPAFSAAMQSLGASFGAGADTESFSVSVSGLSRTFDRAVALWAKAIRSPRLAESDFARVKALRLDDLAQSEEEPSIVSARVAARLLMGDANPYGWPTSGTPQSVSAIGLEAVRKAQGKLLDPSSATIFIAGDLGKDQAVAMLEKEFGSWKSAGAPAGAKSDWSVASRSSLQLAIVDRPGAVQTAIMFASPGIRLDDSKRVPYDLLGTILGGSFTSRLNQNLREDHGYTYGARADFAMGANGGWFLSRSSVRSDVTGAALKEFLAEFKRLRSGDATADEAVKAAKTMRQSLVQSMGSLGGLLGQAERIHVAGLAWSTLSSDLDAAGRVKESELNSMSSSAITVDQGVLVLVGDKASILPQLDGLGLPAPQFLDAWGAPAASERSAGRGSK